ncbi:MAG: trypsin-like peptidase domain-containing protein [Verrucomicrobiae bacterium]|nr:trypsin-like peptidase domain-containing protein [Verrucomicrobiae bacterium]
MMKLCIALSALALAAWAKETPPCDGDIDVARRLENAFVKVAEQASRSVVVVVCARKEETADMQIPEGFEGTPFEYFFRRRGQPGPAPQPRENSAGSGIVYRKDGYILTNLHVVDGAEKIKVRLKDGRELPAEVVGVDDRTDLAVLKVDATDLPAAQLGDSDKVRVGQLAIAIGAPYELEFSFTVGFISAKGRNAIFSRSGSASEDYIETDVAINPGNSGGPLCDIEGRVIGVNTLIRGINRGIGFAIPINMARPVADQLIAHRRVIRPWLGIAIAPLGDNKELQELAKIKDGVVVQEVRPGTPAANSDLKPADIITAVDGVPVKTPRELQLQILSKKVGQRVVLDVVRDGKTLKVPVTTAEMKTEPQLASTRRPETSRAESVFGFRVQTVNPALAYELGLDEACGVVVTDVAENSVAAERGLRPGDVILQVNHQPIKNADEFRAAISRADTKKGVLLYLKREDSATFLVLKEK